MRNEVAAVLIESHIVESYLLIVVRLRFTQAEIAMSSPNSGFVLKQLNGAMRSVFEGIASVQNDE